MKLGDTVAVNFLMEVEGIEKDVFSRKLKVKGMLKTEDGTVTFISLPIEACEVINAIAR